MAKFTGAIGYVTQTESAPGVWTDTVTERQCVGDLVKSSRRLDSSDSGSSAQLNPDISVGNSVSVIADAYALKNIFAIRYVKWNGAYWTATSVEVNMPRILLRMGEVYNGIKA